MTLSRQFLLIAAVGWERYVDMIVKRRKTNMKRRSFFEKLGAGVAIAAFAKTVPVEASISQVEVVKPESVIAHATSLNKSQWEVAQAYNDPALRELFYITDPGAGKTYLGAWLMVNHALNHPGSRLFIANGYMNRLRREVSDHVWSLTREMEGISALRHSKLDNKFLFENGSSISLLDVKHFASDPGYLRYGGVEYMAGVIDDADTIDFEAAQMLTNRIRRGTSQKIVVMNRRGARFSKGNWVGEQLFYPVVYESKYGHKPEWRKIIYG